MRWVLRGAHDQTGLSDTTLDRLCSQAKLANRAPSAPSEESEAGRWQPIETAPKDGTKIDLWVVFTSRADSLKSSSRRETDCFWEAGRWMQEVLDGDYAGEHHEVEYVREGHWNDTIATHWMPIPTPPSAAHIRRGEGTQSEKRAPAKEQEGG